MAKQLDWEKVQQVLIFEAKPNKLFSEEQRATVRFLHYVLPVECAECGRRSKSHWTSTLSFQAMDAKHSFLVLTSATGKVHPPLTPVCGSHPLAAAEAPPLSPRIRKRAAKAAAEGH